MTWLAGDRAALTGVGAVVLVALLMLGVTLHGQTPTQPAASELLRAQAEAHVLRVENAQLRARLSELQATLDGARLTAERAALEQRFRDELKPAAGAVFNWSTLRFDPPTQEPKR